MAKVKLANGSGIGPKIAQLLLDHYNGITSNAELARATGISTSTIGRIIRGEAMPSAEYLARIAHALRVSISDLHDDGDRALYLRPILTWEHPDELPEGDFVMVPRLGVKLSAGNGHERVDVEIDKQAMPQAFRADWIRKRRLRPYSLASLTADGDSMEPRIQDGDALVIDTADTMVQDGRVYAIWYDGGERVKRLYRLPGGGLRIQSDNPAFATIDLGPDLVQHVRVLGRVVHVAGEGGL